MASLVSALEALPAFAAVRDKHLNTGMGGSLSFSTDLLALAVVRRAREKGVVQGLRELAEFLAQEVRGGRIVMLISSVFVSVIRSMS